MSRRHRAALAATIAIAALVAGALGLGGGLGSAGAPLPVGAATPDLTLSSDSTYDVLPSAGRVHVVSVVTATNHLHDTITTQFVFRTAYLTVLPHTSGFRVTASGLKPSVSVSARKSTYTLLKLNFGKNLGSGKSLALRLSFDLRDPGGAPDRPLRISPSIVSFTAWAFATPETPGSSVTVRFPIGYTVAVGRGPLRGPTPDGAGHDTWTSGRLVVPLAFIADLSADRPGDYVDTPISATVGGASASVDLRSWPDDHPWLNRVRGLLVTGLPALGDAIGLPWPVSGGLVVQEALVRTTGGYAGLFDPATSRVLISYTAASIVVLHEAAHAWFNGRLVADRWAAEAFASYYAAVAANELHLKVTSPTITARLRKSAFPLNAWGSIGGAPADAEAYGYAASLAFARAVAGRAGPAGLQAVWARAAVGAGAYQPASGGEPLGQVPDWRNLLDLFEDTTGKSFDDLWRTWIARAEDLPLLDARAVARSLYTKAVVDAGGWQLPRSIRDALRAWQFDVATEQIAEAEAVVAQRTDLELAADAAGVDLPPTLQARFSGDAGLPAAAAEATAEATTLEAIREAAASRPAVDPGTPGVLVAVGLLGEDPDSTLAHSKAAFAAGDLQGAITSASTAAGEWSGAADRGRGRLVSLGLVALALLLVGRMLMLHRWRRRSGWTRE